MRPRPGRRGSRRARARGGAPSSGDRLRERPFHALAVQAHHPVGQRRSSARWQIRSTVRRTAGDRSPWRRSRHFGVEVRGRLVEDNEWGVSENARASAILWTCPAESGRPPPPRRCRSRPAADGRSRLRPPARPPRAPAARPPRDRQDGCCPHGSTQQRRPLWHPGDLAPPGLGRTTSQVDAARDIRPSVGSARRRRSEATVLLPAPLGPTSATVSPGSSSRSRCSTAGSGRPGYENETRSNRASPCAGFRRGRGPERRWEAPRSGPGAVRRPRRRRRWRGTVPPGYGGGGTAPVREQARSAPPRGRCLRRRGGRRRPPPRAPRRPSPRARAPCRRGTPPAGSPWSCAGRSLTAAMCSTCARPRLNARSVGRPRTTSPK